MPDSNTQVYEVTATKKRPKTFDELAGQEFVVSTLKNSLESDKIAHAYLFSGPRGCGKTSAARIMARSLNCEKTAQSDYKGNPCGVCDNCLAISRSASVDVIEIDGASNTGINDVKKIQEEILFPPQTGRYKVYIIDEVHMLSNSAFNALLKTIEEPPPYIIFIFATTELHKVPATIKSRCQQFNFRLIPIETIQEILKNVCIETGVQAEDEALFWIARESTGSMRDAYTLFDQVLSFSDGHIREDLIREKLGLVGLEKLNELAEACADNDTPQVFALIDEIISSGIAIEQCIIDLAAYYRGLLLLKNGITRESLLGYRANLFSEKVLQCYDTIRLEQALELLLDCYRDVRYSVSPRFELETAVSKLSWLSHWVPPPELAAAIKAARTVLNGQAVLHTSTGREGEASPLAGGPAGNNSRSAPNSMTRSASNSIMRSAPNSITRSAPGEAQPPQQNADTAASAKGHSGPPSLSEDFRRRIAMRAGNAAVQNNSSSESGNTDEDDVPMWSTAAPLMHTQSASDTVKEPSPGNEGPVEKFLKVIPGAEVSLP